MLYPVQYTFVTGLDIGLRYPVTLFNSYHRFYNLTKPYEIITYLDTIKHIKNKKYRSMYPYKRNRDAIYDLLSDYIIRMLPPLSILAVENIDYKNGWSSVIQLNIFVNMLKKKCNRIGIQFIKVDATNTSNMCPRCGHIDKNNRDKSKHVYICNNCGLICNDDAIAAWNIHNRAYEMIFGRTFDVTIGGYTPVVVRENKNISFCDMIPSC